MRKFCLMTKVYFDAHVFAQKDLKFLFCYNTILVEA